MSNVIFRRWTILLFLAVGIWCFILSQKNKELNAKISKFETKYVTYELAKKRALYINGHIKDLHMKYEGAIEIAKSAHDMADGLTPKKR